jgi:ribosomal protein L13
MAATASCFARHPRRQGSPIIAASRAIVARLVCAMKTYVATPADRERNWLLVDATGQTLGRLATQIADALRGKRKPITKLKVYAGPEHPHAAQQPQPMETAQ